MKLNEWLDTWISGYLKHNIKQRSLNTYKHNIINHINPILGFYDMEELTPQVLQNFVIQKLEHGNLKTGGKLANNTVISIMNTIKHAIKDAVNMEVATKDCTSKIKLPSQEETKVTAFEKWEQEKIEKYCMNNKDNYIGIVICLYTGLRIGELLALTWDDIDFERNYMTISKSAYEGEMDGKIQKIVDTPKTKNSNRVIPIPKQLMDVLRQRKKKSRSIYVIATRYGGMVGTRSFQKTFERILSKLGIEKKNFHSLRHTFATRALEFGMDVKTVSELLGHKSPMITLERYTHSLMSYKTDMMNKFGKLLSC